MHVSAEFGAGRSTRAIVVSICAEFGESMSGSGGGGGGGFVPRQQDCASLAFDTQLSSPRAAIVAGIIVGQVLELVTQVMSGTTVVLALSQGQVAGGLASPLVQRLRECIESGTLFNATVLSISGGQVRVRVRAVGP